MRDRREHDAARGGRDQGRAYDEPPFSEPVGPDDYLTVTPPRPFGPPEKIAALTGARPKGRGWKEGRCYICNERSVTINWNTRRDKTLVNCCSANWCPKIEVVKAISQRHNVSLDLRPSSIERKPHRRLDDTKGKTPIERALWHCTKAEQQLYEFLKKRGDGPTRLKDMPSHNAKRAIPVLEYLGLIRGTRGGFDPYDGRRQVTSYEAARLTLLHRLEPNDHKLKTAIRAIRKADVDIDQTLKQNLNNISQANHRRTTRKPKVILTQIRTLPHRRAADAQAPRRMLTRAERSRRRKAAREAGAKAFVDVVGQVVRTACGGAWEGSWRDLLAAAPRPSGCRAWPLSKKGVMSAVWVGREALQPHGLKHEWVHVDALSGRRVLVAIRFVPNTPSEEVAAGC